MQPGHQVGQVRHPTCERKMYMLCTLCKLYTPSATCERSRACAGLCTPGTAAVLALLTGAPSCA